MKTHRPHPELVEGWGDLPMPKPDQKPILVAAIAGAFGVRGEVRLKSFTENPAACLDYAPFVDKDGKPILHIKAARKIKGGLAVFADEVSTREEAEAKKSTKLYALREKFAELNEDDFYQSDLLGLRVEDQNGAPLGRIKAVVNYGASDLLEIIDTPGVDGSWNLPFTRAHVPLVDIAGGKVVLQGAETFFLDDKEDTSDAGGQP
ncbi:MAG: ribosome maturation factor RimM [Robiginitomaculum sp.]|nr:ribosome maturation factor RimM [Robiginitomaculum sp.]